MRAECKQIFVTVDFPPADKCGGNIRISSASYLTSPGYPLSYAPSQRCTWVISAPGPHQRILINFNPHFDLEDRECKWVAPPVWAQVCVKEPILRFIKKRKQLQIFQFSISGWMTEWYYQKNKPSVYFPFFFVVLNLWNRTMIRLFIFDSHQHMRSLVWAWSCGALPHALHVKLRHLASVGSPDAVGPASPQQRGAGRLHPCHLSLGSVILVNKAWPPVLKQVWAAVAEGIVGDLWVQSLNTGY